MKLKSLLLGSAAVFALSTAAQAADPMDPTTSVVSLDACDAFGITGLTISSESACLSITGEVSYSFEWGDYDDDVDFIGGSDFSDVDESVFAGDDFDGDDGEDDDQDWESNGAWELTFEATSDSDLGQARATVTLEGQDVVTVEDEDVDEPDTIGDNEVVFSDAFVSVGDATVLTAGIRDASVYVTDDSSSFAYLGTFIDMADTSLATGGHVVQLVSEVGNGINVAVGLENLDTQAQPEAIDGSDVDDEDITITRDGALIGSVSIDQAWGSGHLSVAGNDVLDGFSNSEFFTHAGATLDFDPVMLRAMGSYDGEREFYRGLLSAEYGFDMFTLAGHAEYGYDDDLEEDEYGFGASVGADVTETVALNLGFRYFNYNDTTLADDDSEIFGGDNEGYQVEGQAVAAVTENISATGVLGAFFEGELPDDEDPIVYGELGLSYTPSDSVVIDGGVEANTVGAYRLSFGASKSF